MSLTVCVRYTEGADQNIPLPQYETSSAAGMDLRANFLADERGGQVLEPGQRALIPTGMALAIPNGYEAQIRPRSGLALKHGVTLVNTPGTIDADYRGPLGVILINHSDQTYEIHHGDRIAQILFAPVVQGTWQLVETLDETERGVGGFGSTGQG